MIHPARPTLAEVPLADLSLQALRLRTSVVRAGQHEATTTNLVRVFTSDMGHCVDQVRVTHGFSIS